MRKSLIYGAVALLALGTVEARILSRVGFEVGATLETLAVDAGDSVRKGQELAVLHQGEQEARVLRVRAALAANAASLAKSKAALDRAEAVLAQRVAANDRQKALARQDVASAQRAEEAQRDEDVARHAEPGTVARIGTAPRTLP